MKYIYGGIALLAILFGIILFAGAQNAAQQIGAYIMFVIGGVFMVAAEVNELAQRLTAGAVIPAVPISKTNS
jgi:hypothetical protein